MRAELIPTLLETYQESLVSLISLAVDAEVYVSIDVHCVAGLGETLPDLGKAAGWSHEDRVTFAVARYSKSPYQGDIRLYGSNRPREIEETEEAPE